MATGRAQSHPVCFKQGSTVPGNHLGLPYGSYARFILLFLQSEADKDEKPRDRAWPEYADLAWHDGVGYRRKNLPAGE